MEQLPIPIDRSVWPIAERALDLRRDRAVVNYQAPNPPAEPKPRPRRRQHLGQFLLLWAALYGTAWLIGHYWPW